MANREIFDKFGAAHIKSVLPKDLTHFLTHILQRQYHEMAIQGIPRDDVQVKNALAVMSHDIIFETVGERVWPFLENILGEELIPTYSYARLYTNDNVLEPHTDRPACEISLSIQLGRSHHYAWPFYANKMRFDLAEGDAVLYKGCEVQHWREACAGPEGYYSGQVFCHFVRANGPNTEHAGDKRWKGGLMPFDRYRTMEMSLK
jgi:hypothetical protein